MTDDGTSPNPNEHTKLGNWDYLPNDPTLFFGLREGFDRRELKRAYGALIRKFKPETHPTEFQRIRLAYERLESSDRYGSPQRMDLSSATNDVWRIERPVQREEENKSEAAFQSTQDAFERSPRLMSFSIFEAAIATPHETYLRLKEKRDRTPQEYFVLAVLSDLVEEPADLNKFFEWLLMAFQESNSDPGILALISDYLYLDVAIRDAPSTLLLIAERLKSPVFYRLSEKLWERLIRQSEPIGFIPLLAKCDDFIRETHPRSRFAFYLRILRTAIWKAPASWVDQQLDRLELDSKEMDESSLLDLELISLMQAYLESSAHFAFASQTRRTIDSILKAYCNQDNANSTTTILLAYNELACDYEGLIQSFPFSKDNAEGCIFVLLSIIADEYSGVIANESNTTGSETLNRLAEVALSDIHLSLSSVTNEVRRIAFPYKWLIFSPILLSWSAITIPIVMPLSSIGKNGSLLAVCMFALSVLICFLFYFCNLYPKRFKPIVDSKTDAYLLNIYEERWRKRMFRYLQSSGESYGAALMRLQRIALSNTGFWEKIDERWIDLLLENTKKDIGLQIFARCQRFVV